MSPSIPPYLQSTVDLLARAFHREIDASQYMALLALLGEHMCEENLGIAVGAAFGKDPFVVVNDLARAQSIDTPSEASISAVRARLQEVGLSEWLAEE